MTIHDFILSYREGRLNKAALCRAAGIDPSNTRTFDTLLKYAARLDAALSNLGGLGSRLEVRQNYPLPEKPTKEQLILLRIYQEIFDASQQLELLRDYSAGGLTPDGQNLEELLTFVFNQLRRSPLFWEPDWRTEE